MNTNGPLLPFVLSAGLLDSLNPCAIAVLLLFIALMFTLRKNRATIITLGLIYITAVYLTYFGIGLGLLKIIHIFGVPHFMAILGAWIVIAVGAWGLKDVMFPGSFQILTIPLGSRQLIASWLMKATVPAIIVAGLLVGLTEFPCSGAIYLATLGLLTSKTTYLTGILYLLIYNLMFVLPLIIILFIATNRYITEKLINLDEANSVRLRLISSLIMIGIGISILVWFV